MLLKKMAKETTRFRFRLRPKWLTVLVLSRSVSK